MTKILSDNSVPVTSPVDVLTLISAASQPLKPTSPVLLSIWNFFSATVSVSVISPVLLLTETVPFTFAEVTSISPVEAVISSSPAFGQLSEISPVSSLTVNVFVTEAEHSTSPVLLLTVSVSKVKPDGIVTSPVCVSICRDAYADCGR